MAQSRRSGARRLRAALLVTGITLAILLLIFLQFALPYYLGPLGLVTVVILDVGIYLETHRRRIARKRRLESRRIGSGATGRHDVARPRRPLNDEYVAAIGLIVFVVGISLQGAGLQVSGRSGPNLALFEIGSAVLLVASFMLWPYEWRYYDPRTESEKYDTTDDH